MTDHGAPIYIGVILVFVGAALYVVRLPESKRRERMLACLLAYTPFAVVAFKGGLLDKKGIIPWIFDFFTTASAVGVAFVVAYKGEKQDRATKSFHATAGVQDSALSKLSDLPIQLRTEEVVSLVHGLDRARQTKWLIFSFVMDFYLASSFVFHVGPYVALLDSVSQADGRPGVWDREAISNCRCRVEEIYFLCETAREEGFARAKAAKVASKEKMGGPSLLRTRELTYKPTASLSNLLEPKEAPTFIVYL